MFKEDLVIDKYYTTINNYDYTFRYKGFSNFMILLDGYYLYKNNFVVLDKIGLVLDTKFKEIDFKDIVDYFPDNHPDKKHHIRQQKIKYLLK